MWRGQRWLYPERDRHEIDQTATRDLYSTLPGSAITAGYCQNLSSEERSKGNIIYITILWGLRYRRTHPGTDAPTQVPVHHPGTGASTQVHQINFERPNRWYDNSFVTMLTLILSTSNPELESRAFFRSLTAINFTTCQTVIGVWSTEQSHYPTVPYPMSSPTIP